MYQKCPICNGEGKLINTETTNPYTVCKTCNGAGIINELTGLPPVSPSQNETPNELASRLGFPPMGHI